MRDYFRAVTLGAFTLKNEDRIALLFSSIGKTGGFALCVHFLLLSICLNFPVIYNIARIPPYELYSRLYGENFLTGAFEAEGEGGAFVSEDDFNIYMIESGYGANVLLPVLATAFGLILVIQAAFYLFAAFFLKLARLNTTRLTFFDRLGLSLFSSTLPALFSALLGIFLPAVHIIVFYFMVMFLAFQRSRLCSGDNQGSEH